MAGAAIRKSSGMPVVVDVNETIGHAAEQHVEANAESEGYHLRHRRMVVAAEKLCDHGPKINQRERYAKTEI